MVPPIPTTVTSTMVDGPVNLDEVNTENPYDEIPGRKFNGQQYPHNPYAEINDVASRTRDSGVQLSMERNMTLSQPNCKLIFTCAVYNGKLRTIKAVVIHRTSQIVDFPCRCFSTVTQHPPAPKTMHETMAIKIRKKGSGLSVHVKKAHVVFGPFIYIYIYYIHDLCL